METGTASVVSIEAKRLAAVTVLMLGVVAVAAFVGDVEKRGYERFAVGELFRHQPFGEKVAVAGTVERVLERSSGYASFLLAGDGATVKVYCSGNLSVQQDDRVSVMGEFTTHDGVPEVSTECFMVRGREKR